MNDLVSIRMRASSAGSHISGAERMVREDEVHTVAGELIQRALAHERGRPDSITLSIDPIGTGNFTSLPALPIITVEITDHLSGRSIAVEELIRAGVSQAAAESALKAIAEGAASPSVNMRGAMIIDAQTGERLEPDRTRGVRARHLDYDANFLPQLTAILCENGLDKSHLKEALALATKVANAPFSVAELCISDDPSYTTGYVASKANGYVRITRLKEEGDRIGGRAFFVDETNFELNTYLEYMRETPILITGPAAISDVR